MIRLKQRKRNREIEEISVPLAFMSGEKQMIIAENYSKQNNIFTKSLSGLLFFSGCTNPMLYTNETISFVCCGFHTLFWEISQNSHFSESAMYFNCLFNSAISLLLS